jgi:hypothetical protein
MSEIHPVCSIHYVDINGHFRYLNLNFRRPIYLRGYGPKIWLYMVQYLHFRVLKFPHISIEYTSTYMLYIYIYI